MSGVYYLNYTGGPANFVCGGGYGTWITPVEWFNTKKHIDISGVFDAGLKILKYPSLNQIFYQVNSTPSIITTGVDLKAGESLYLQIVPKCMSPTTFGTNTYSVNATVSISEISPQTQYYKWLFTDNTQYKFKGFGNNAYDKREKTQDISGNIASVGADYILNYQNSNSYIYGYGSGGSGGVARSIYPQGSGGVISLSAGFDHAISISKDFTYFMWGANDSGQVWPWGSSGVTLADAVSVSAGYKYSLVAFKNGNVSGWGSNKYGQISNLSSITGVIKCSAGYEHSLFLLNNGTVTGRGSNQFGQLPDFSLFKSGIVTDICAGPYQSFFIVNSGGVSGRLLGFGSDAYGQISGGSGLTGVIDVASAINHTVAVLSNNIATGWGYNDCGQLDFDNNSGVYHVGAGNSYSLLWYKNDDFTFDSFKINFDLSTSGDKKIPLKNLSVVSSLPKIKINKSAFYYGNAKYKCLYDEGYSMHKSIFAVSVSGKSLSGLPQYFQSGFDGYLINPKISISDSFGNDYIGNDDWTKLDDSTKFYLTGNHLIDPTKFYSGDPAQIVKHLMSNSGQQYTFVVENEDNNGVYNYNLNVPTKFIYNFNQSEIQNTAYDKIIAPQDAYITYNVTTGTTSKNVFSYALEVADFIKYNGRILTNAPVSVYAYTPIINKYPSANGNTWSYIQTYQRICSAVGACDDPEGKDKETTICWTGRDVTGDAYLKFVADTLTKYRSNTLNNDFQSESNQFFSQSGVDVLFNSWTGVILFGDFVSGDTLNFSYYNFGENNSYEKTYKNFYVDAPPYPEISSFSLTYGKDFTTPSGLISGLNNSFKVKNNTSKLWYPYDCPTGFGETGIFIDLISGDYMASGEFLDPYEYYGTGMDTGIYSMFSGRLIKIKSNHLQSGGYSMSINLSNIRADVEAEYKDSVEYLLPRHIELYGSNDGISWDTVDRRTGIKWESLEPMSGKVILDGLDELNDVIPNVYPEINGNIEDFLSTVKFPSGSFEELFTITQYKYKNSKVSYCPPIASVNDISVVWPTGWSEIYYRSGKHPCKITGDNQDDGCGCPDPKAKNYDAYRTCDCPDLECCKYDELPTSGTGPKYGSFTYYRTGWVVDPAWLGLGTNELDKINYNYYKLYFSGFSNETGIKNNIIPTNSIYVKSINLFSAHSGQKPIITGDPICIIGSNYSVDVMGYVPVRITGNLTGELLERHSGVRKFNNSLILAPISGHQSGDLILFNKQSGRLTSSYGTGIFSGEITGQSYIETGLFGWFYDSGNQSVYFKQSFSGFITGSGKLSGNYLELHQDYINKQLSFGGMFSQLVSSSVTTGVLVTGKITTHVLRGNLTGATIYSGNVYGNPTFGYLALSSGVNINLSDLNLEVDYLDGGITGYSNASAYIHYNSPDLFDFISINNKTISFNTDTVNFSAPDFYNNSGTLLDIINGYPNDFGVSGVIEDNKIKLISLSSGKAGNDIKISAGQGYNSGINYPSVDSSNLTGGFDLYTKIKATGFYTGFLNAVYLSTGFYSTGSASGTITGDISSYQGIRSFTGLWNLITGDFYSGYESFNQNGWINGDKYSNIVGGTGYCLSPSIFDFTILYSDLFSVNNSGDIVKITISGLNTNSGFYYYITGTA